jgi:hypothetical protein
MSSDEGSADGGDEDGDVGSDDCESFMYGTEAKRSRGDGDEFLGSLMESYDDGGSRHPHSDGCGNSTASGGGGDDDEEGDAEDTSRETLMKMLTEEEQGGLFRKPTPRYSDMAIRERMKEMQGHVEVVNPSLYGEKGVKYEVRLKGIDGEVLANGYSRVIADEHGCYVQFERRHLADQWKTTSKLVAVRSITKFAEEYGWIPLAANGTPLFFSGDKWDDSNATKSDHQDSRPSVDEHPRDDAGTSGIGSIAERGNENQQLDPNFVGPTMSPSGKVISPYRDKTPDGRYTLEHFIYMVQPPSASKENEKASKKDTKLKKAAAAIGQTKLSTFFAARPRCPDKMTATGEGHDSEPPPKRAKHSDGKNQRLPTEAFKRPGYTKHKDFTRGCFYIRVANVYVIPVKS